MRKLSSFDGKLNVRVSQTDKHGNETELFFNVSGVRKLTIGMLAGTIKGEVEQLMQRSKFTGVRLLKKNLPIRLVIKDGEDKMIADTVHMNKALSVKMTAINMARFGKVLFDGLVHMRSNPKIVNILDQFNADELTIAGQDKVLFDRVAELAQDAEVVDTDTVNAE